MRFIADFHIHSKYARATSKDMNLIALDHWADDKGIQVMGTGDFTHPQYFKEIESQLEPAEPGLYTLKKSLKEKTVKGTFSDTRFMLTVEISGIYTRAGKSHRIHNLIFTPDIATAKKINTGLSLIGNLKSDGRPILGLDSEELAKIVFNINQKNVIVPAHAWTPWFSIFGSMSGFNSIEECFGSYSKEIFAIETGLSSDPLMNWRLSALDDIALISNSDSHSAQRIGREANIFDTELSYDHIINAIKEGRPNAREKGNGKEFLATIEFFPEEGKYHYDGHRDCGVVLHPDETKKIKGVCPKCGKKLTIGVMNRVNELADRSKEDAKKVSSNRVPYKNLIPLDEIIAEAVGTGVGTKKVTAEYNTLIRTFKNELNALLNVNEKDIAEATNPRIAEGVRRVRNGNVNIVPGHDGEYGKISIFKNEERITAENQKSLF